MTTKNNFLKSPTFIKILSFFMAFILWFFVAGDKQDMPPNEVRRTFSDIPLYWRNLGEDLVVTEIEESVTLSLQGAEQAFDGLTPADLEAYVDLSGKKKGYHEIRINTVAPPRVSVVRIEPGKAKITIEDLINKQMSVEYEIYGEPTGGFIFDKATFEPQDVFVRGPRQKVNLIKKVIFKIDVSISAREIVQNIPLHPVDAQGNFVGGVDIIPEEVEVMVNLTYPQRDLPVEPVFAGQTVKIQEVEIEPAVVTVKGPQHILDNLTSITTETIDLKGRQGRFTTEAPLSLPDEVLVVNQKTVRLHIVLDHGT